MTSLRKLALGGLLALGVLAPTTASADEENKAWVEIVKTGSDADKTIAKARAATKVIEYILKDWSFSAIRGEQRKKLIHSVFDLFRQVKFKPRSRRKPNGKHRFIAYVSMSEARNRVLDALNVRKTFGKDKFIIVAYHKDWYRGGGLARDDIKVIHKTVSTACSDYMNSHRFRESPAANNREKVYQAAISLGATPQTTKLKSFAMMFQAPLVVTVKGSIKFEKFPADSPHARQWRGYLRCRGVKGRMYDKNSDTILANFTLKSVSKYTSFKDATANELPQPWVGTSDSLSEATERYANLVGKMIAVNVMKRLFDKFYASQPRPTVTTKASPRECPGCGDKIIDGAIAECPACESPLPKAKTTVVGTGKTRRTPTARDYYQLRFKGWNSTEVDEVVQALEEDKDFDDWENKGQMKIFTVYKCTFVGRMIVRQVYKALEDCGYKNNAKVTKTGNNINIIKKAK